MPSRCAADSERAGKCTRHDVPVLHGDARGGALDARARERTAAGDGRQARRRRARRRRAASSLRPVPRMPGVQGGVSGRRRRGENEERVPGRVLAPARHARSRARARPCRSSRAVGQSIRADLERLSQKRAGSRVQRAPARSRSTAHPAGLGAADDSAAVSRGRHPERPATVALFADTFTNHYHPSVGMAGLEVHGSGSGTA